MGYEKFDVSKLDRLNDPARLEQIDPDVLWAAVGNPHPRAIVDIGAGTGLFAARFAQMATAATVYAVDTEQPMLDYIADHRAPGFGERLVPVLSTEVSIPLPDGIADLVVMINLHHELALPESIYAEAARLAARGGRLLVVDWAPGAEGRGPSQAVRVTSEQLMAAAEHAGFMDVAAHAGLAQHSLVTARKP